MENYDIDIERLKVAEHQFRLACTINLAVTNNIQPLDVPVEWTFGKHRTTWDEFGLRADQAGLAASFLERTTTYSLASVIRDLLVSKFENPKDHKNVVVKNAYQVSRLLRNAFAHSCIDPVWSIDKDCREKVFEVGEVIRIDTSGLDRKRVEWTDYGGPLAVFKFGRFVREDLLGDRIDSNRELPPYPKQQIFQQGRLQMKKVDSIPTNAILVKRIGPGETLHLGDGHYIAVEQKNDQIE